MEAKSPMLNLSAEYVNRGETIDYANTAEGAELIPAGSLLAFGRGVAVAAVDIPAGAVGALHIEGVYRLAKNTDPATKLDIGERVYVKDGKLTKDSADATAVGVVMAPAAEADKTVLIKLNI